jgi:hypothetical protein
MGLGTVVAQRIGHVVERRDYSSSQRTGGSVRRTDGPV